MLQANFNSSREVQNKPSAKSQKGRYAVQQSFIENQKGAVAVQFSMEHPWTALTPFWFSADETSLESTHVCYYWCNQQSGQPRHRLDTSHDGSVPSLQGRRIFHNLLEEWIFFLITWFYEP